MIDLRELSDKELRKRYGNSFKLETILGEDIAKDLFDAIMSHRREIAAEIIRRAANKKAPIEYHI